MTPERGRAGSAPPLILASQSPRRAQLLRTIGLRFDVIPADVDEAHGAGEEAGAYAERLARQKAGAVGTLRPDALVIGCDTVVVIDGVLLGKPRTEDEAVDMLLRLQGRQHFVDTGVAVAHGAEVRSDLERVRVHFRPLDERTARAYVATGEPMDKAGAYGIQGYGATLVDRIEGDFFAVMGMPIVRLIALFETLGWRYDFRGLESLR